MPPAAVFRGLVPSMTPIFCGRIRARKACDSVSKFEMSRLAAIAAACVVLFLVAPVTLETLRGAGGAEWKSYIGTVPPLEAARALAQGGHVVFLDIREPEEFVQMHIPGAVSLPLRDLHQLSPRDLPPADWIIPY